MLNSMNDLYRSGPFEDGVDMRFDNRCECGEGIEEGMTVCAECREEFYKFLLDGK